MWKHYLFIYLFIWKHCTNVNGSIITLPLLNLLSLCHWNSWCVCLFRLSLAPALDLMLSSSWHLGPPLRFLRDQKTFKDLYRRCLCLNFFSGLKYFRCMVKDRENTGQSYSITGQSCSITGDYSRILRPFVLVPHHPYLNRLQRAFLFPSVK